MATQQEKMVISFSAIGQEAVNNAYKTMAAHAETFKSVATSAFKVASKHQETFTRGLRAAQDALKKVSSTFRSLAPQAVKVGKVLVKAFDAIKKGLAGINQSVGGFSAILKRMTSLNDKTKEAADITLRFAQVVKRVYTEAGVAVKNFNQYLKDTKDELFSTKTKLKILAKVLKLVFKNPVKVFKFLKTLKNLSSKFKDMRSEIVLATTSFAGLVAVTKSRLGDKSTKELAETAFTAYKRIRMLMNVYKSFKNETTLGAKAKALSPLITSLNLTMRSVDKTKKSIDKFNNAKTAFNFSGALKETASLIRNLDKTATAVERLVAAGKDTKTSFNFASILKYSVKLRRQVNSLSASFNTLKKKAKLVQRALQYVFPSHDTTLGRLIHKMTAFDLVLHKVTKQGSAAEKAFRGVEKVFSKVDGAFRTVDKALKPMSRTLKTSMKWLTKLAGLKFVKKFVFTDTIKQAVALNQALEPLYATMRTGGRIVKDAVVSWFGLRTNLKKAKKQYTDLNSAASGIHTSLEKTNNSLKTFANKTDNVKNTMSVFTHVVDTLKASFNNLETEAGKAGSSIGGISSGMETVHNAAIEAFDSVSRVNGELRITRTEYRQTTTVIHEQGAALAESRTQIMRTINTSSLYRKELSDTRKIIDSVAKAQDNLNKKFVRVKKAPSAPASNVINPEIKAQDGSSAKKQTESEVKETKTRMDRIVEIEKAGWAKRSAAEAKAENERRKKRQEIERELRKSSAHFMEQAAKGLEKQNKKLRAWSDEEIVIQLEKAAKLTQLKKKQQAVIDNLNKSGTEHLKQSLKARHRQIEDETVKELSLERKKEHNKLAIQIEAAKKARRLRVAQSRATIEQPPTPPPTGPSLPKGGGEDQRKPIPVIDEKAIKHIKLAKDILVQMNAEMIKLAKTSHKLATTLKSVESCICGKGGQGTTVLGNIATDALRAQVGVEKTTKEVSVLTKQADKAVESFTGLKGVVSTIAGNVSAKEIVKATKAYSKLRRVIKFLSRAKYVLPAIPGVGMIYKAVEAFKRLKLATHAYVKVQKTFYKGMIQLGKSIKSISYMTSGLGASLTALTGTAMAIGLAGEKSAATEQAFYSLGGSLRDLNDLKKASFGLIDDTSLMTAMNTAKAFQISMADTKKLMEVATGASVMLGTTTADAFRDIVTGVSRGSAQIIDNLGIKMPKASQIYADAVRKQMEETGRLKKRALMTDQERIDSIKRIKAEVENLTAAEKNHYMVVAIAEGASVQRSNAKLAKNATIGQAKVKLENAKSDMMAEVGGQLQAVDAFKPILDLIPKVKKLLKPLGLIFSHGIATAAKFIDAILPIGKTVISMLNPIIRIIDNLLSSMGDSFKAVTSFKKPILLLFKTIAKAIKPLIKQLPSFIRSISKYITNVILKLKPVLEIFVQLAGRVMDLFMQKMDSLDLHKNSLTGYVDLFIDLAGTIANATLDVLEFLGGVKDLVLGLMNLSTVGMAIKAILATLNYSAKGIELLGRAVAYLAKTAGQFVATLSDLGMEQLRDYFGFAAREEEWREGRQARMAQARKDFDEREMVRIKKRDEYIQKKQAQVSAKRREQAKKQQEYDQKHKKALEEQLHVINDTWTTQTSLALSYEDTLKNLDRVIVKEKILAKVKQDARDALLGTGNNFAQQIKTSITGAVESFNVYQKMLTDNGAKEFGGNITDMFDSVSLAIVENSASAEEAIKKMNTFAEGFVDMTPLVKRNNELLDQRNQLIQKMKALSPAQISAGDYGKMRGELNQLNMKLATTAAGMGVNIQKAREFFGATDAFILGGSNATFMSEQLGMVKSSYYALSQAAREYKADDLFTMGQSLFKKHLADSGMLTQFEKDQKSKAKARYQARKERLKAEAEASAQLQYEAYLQTLSPLSRALEDAAKQRRDRLETIAKNDIKGIRAINAMYAREAAGAIAEGISGYAKSAMSSLQNFAKGVAEHKKEMDGFIEQGLNLTRSKFDKGMLKAAAKRDEALKKTLASDVEAKRAIIAIYLDDIQKVAKEEVARREKLNLFDNLFTIKFDASGFAEGVRSRIQSLMSGLEKNQESWGKIALPIDYTLANMGLMVEAINTVSDVRKKAAAINRKLLMGELSISEAHEATRHAYVEGASGMISAVAGVAKAFTKDRRKQAAIEATFEAAKSVAAFADLNFIGGAMHALAATKFAMMAGTSVPKKQKKEERDKNQLKGVTRTKNVQAASRTVVNNFYSVLDRHPGAIVAEAVNEAHQRGVGVPISDQAIGSDVQVGY